MDEKRDARRAVVKNAWKRLQAAQERIESDKTGSIFRENDAKSEAREIMEPISLLKAEFSQVRSLDC